MAELVRIAFTYRSEDDSQSPPEKKAKKESWGKREARFRTKKGSDCKIIVGDKEILTHKFVLNEFPFFESKFNPEGNYKVVAVDQVIIEGFEYGIVNTMIEYLYTFKVKLSIVNVEDLFMISDKVWIESVRNRNRNRNRACTRLALSRIVVISQLRSGCIERIM